MQLMIFSCLHGVGNLPVLNLAIAKTSELWMVHRLCRSDRDLSFCHSAEEDGGGTLIPFWFLRGLQKFGPK